ncbi:tyrosine-type recombinase/integrase [Ruoffia halotolerans]|uniref:tyrosine-type recombinase/integrase n=1 Tax=Ruoffia halotolerans TaxID=2748684 RepID=UPI002E27D0DE|nr:tyrosine-type recombinase/integrase [Ruoffia halotolerans]
MPLKHLDFTNFVELRDGCIFLLIWETGIRLGTVSRVTEDMVDFKDKLIHYTGESMKNRKRLSLPLSDVLLEMLRVLMRVNKTVLKHNKLEPDQHYLFISSLGNLMDSRSFGKRVYRYKKLTGFKNINSHPIRCGFSKRLLDKGVNIATISKALNHKRIYTTTRQLHIGMKK